MESKFNIPAGWPLWAWLQENGTVVPVSALKKDKKYVMSKGLGSTIEIVSTFEDASDTLKSGNEVLLSSESGASFFAGPRTTAVFYELPPMKAGRKSRKSRKTRKTRKTRKSTTRNRY
jgi:hypothetical protein